MIFDLLTRPLARSIKPTFQPATRAELLAEYALTMPSQTGKILQFNGIGDKDAYNPAFINQNGMRYLAARVESRQSRWQTDCYDPQVMFFENMGHGQWSLIPDAPVYNMEDPFCAWVHDEQGEELLVLGGVEASPILGDQTITTVFYKGKDIKSLEDKPFARIPGMKDIRLIELSDQKRMVICSRPRGGKAGIGMVGVAIIDNLSQINSKVVDNAPLFVDQVASDIKMGSNELYCTHYYQNDKLIEFVGIIGHVSFRDPETGDEHYYVASFCFDPNDPIANPSWRRPKIIAKRENFEACPAKEARLSDVLFPGGIEDLGNNIVRLYTGVSDARIGVIDIPNPFAHCHIVSR